MALRHSDVKNTRDYASGSFCLSVCKTTQQNYEGCSVPALAVSGQPASQCRSVSTREPAAVSWAAGVGGTPGSQWPCWAKCPRENVTKPYRLTRRRRISSFPIMMISLPIMLTTSARESHYHLGNIGRLSSFKKIHRHTFVLLLLVVYMY